MQRLVELAFDFHESVGLALLFFLATSRDGGNQRSPKLFEGSGLSERTNDASGRLEKSSEISGGGPESERISNTPSSFSRRVGQHLEFPRRPVHRQPTLRLHPSLHPISGLPLDVSNYHSLHLFFRLL